MEEVEGSIPFGSTLRYAVVHQRLRTSAFWLQHWDLLHGRPRPSGTVSGALLPRLHPLRCRSVPAGAGEADPGAVQPPAESSASRARDFTHTKWLSVQTHFPVPRVAWCIERQRGRAHARSHRVVRLRLPSFVKGVVRDALVEVDGPADHVRGRR